MRPFRATQDSARLMSLIFISVQIRIDQLRPTPLGWGRSFFIIYCGIRMLCCRHRGFSWLCSFSDVKGNITRHYVPFSASLRPSIPPAVRPSPACVGSTCRPPPIARRTFVLSPVHAAEYSSRPPARGPPCPCRTGTATHSVFLNIRACARMYMRLIGRSTLFENLSTRNSA